MKRILPLLVTAAVLCFFSCAKKDLKGRPAAAEKKWIIASDINFRPFEYMNAKNQLVGIDVDLLAAIAKDQGFSYELKATGWEEGISSVKEGRAHALLAGATITQQRIDDGWIFSDGYYTATQTFAVPRDSQINAFSDLNGKIVAVKGRTTGKLFAESLKEKYGYEIKVFEDSSVMYQDVAQGKSDACVEDTPIIASNIKDSDLPFRIPVGMENEGAPYGLVIMKNENRELLDMFNRGLKNIREKGIYQKILDRYL